MLPEEPRPPFDPAPLRVFGAVLVMLGVAIAGLILWYVHTVLTAPDAFPMIVSLMPKEATVALKDETSTLTIPREVVQAVAYVVFAILLGVLGGLARTFISAGAGLLKHTIPQSAPAQKRTSASSTPHID